MKQRAAQAGPGGPNAPPSVEAARTMPPAAAPFSTPQEKQGLKATAMAKVHIAMTMLGQALPELGVETDEGQAARRALDGLAKFAGERDNSDLVPAEVLQMNMALPQMGGGTQIQQELARQQMQNRQAAMQPPGMGRQPPIP